MAEKPERPASLQRRRPRPAPDEHIDPVDYTSPRATSPQVSTPPVWATPVAESPVASTPKRGRGRPRREPTIQLGVRVAQDVSDLIEELTEHDDTPGP